MTVANDMVLGTRGLGKTYQLGKLRTHAVRDVDFQLRQGEFVTVSGPSGCGKSTLLSLLGLIEPPSSGRIEFLGRDVATMGERERARARAADIGIVFQSFHLIPELSARENVALKLRNAGVEKSRRAALAEQALTDVGLGHRLSHLPGQLSGGQQQRVALARAMALAPRVLLADEPTGNLDSASGEQVMGMLRAVHARGVAVVLVTHDPRYACIGERNLGMSDGLLTMEAAA